MKTFFFVICMLLAPAALGSQDQWVPVLKGPHELYLVLKQSISAENGNTQFILKTIFEKPVKTSVGAVKYFVENTLLLCNENQLITTSQLAYDENDKLINTDIHAHVFKSNSKDGMLITEIIRYGCNKPAPKEKDVFI